MTELNIEMKTEQPDSKLKYINQMWAPVGKQGKVSSNKKKLLSFIFSTSQPLGGYQYQTMLPGVTAFCFVFFKRKSPCFISLRVTPYVAIWPNATICSAGRNHFVWLYFVLWFLLLSIFSIISFLKKNSCILLVKGSDHKRSYATGT